MFVQLCFVYYVHGVCSVLLSLCCCVLGMRVIAHVFVVVVVFVKCWCALCVLWAVVVLLLCVVVVCMCVFVLLVL